MCSIAGFISPDPKSPRIVEAMSDALKHRGPDGRGFFMDARAGVYLGFNRLSIIDLSMRARQPILNEDKNVAAMVNGEIYNYRQLKRELQDAGHIFRSDSDSEVVVHAYEEWGEDFAGRLNGMFAVAVYDQRQGKVALVRDPIGIKPLYYLSTEDFFAFASETKAFFAIDPALYEPQFNMEAVDKLLLFPFIPDDSTILKGVCKIPAGSMLIFENREVRLKRYWLLENNAEQRISFEEACRQFEEKMCLTVESHLQSDVPVGIALSGGVDSGFLASVATKRSSKPVVAFTVSLGGPKDESAFALETSRYLGLKTIFLKIDMSDILQRIEDIAGSFDDLSCPDAGLITHYLLAEKIKEAGYKVVLSGEGADEILGGYPWFAVGEFPYSSLPKQGQYGILYRRISKNLTHPFVNRGQEVFNEIMEGFGEPDAFRRISRFEICRQLPNGFLMKLDKGAMAHGVEVRVPYLDRPLVEFAYSLPGHFKRSYDRSGNKKILRHAAASHLPQRIAMRKKQGFLFPVGRFLQENRETVKDHVLRSGSLARERLSLKQLKSLWDFHGIPFLSHEREALLWKLYLLEIWKGRFSKEAGPRADTLECHQKANSCCVGL